MQKYILVHHHRFGISTYLVQSESFPIEDKVVKKCHIDFEPDLEEYIDITETDGIFKVIK